MKINRFFIDYIVHSFIFIWESNSNATDNAGANKVVNVNLGYLQYNYIVISGTKTYYKYTNNMTMIHPRYLLSGSGNQKSTHCCVKIMRCVARLTIKVRPHKTWSLQSWFLVTITVNITRISVFYN